jgi:hypothetical protein
MVSAEALANKGQSFAKWDRLTALPRWSKSSLVAFIDAPAAITDLLAYISRCLEVWYGGIGYTAQEWWNELSSSPYFQVVMHISSSLLSARALRVG